jgi:hypothetical protein
MYFNGFIKYLLITFGIHVLSKPAIIKLFMICDLYFILWQKRLKMSIKVYKQVIDYLNIAL